MAKILKRAIDYSLDLRYPILTSSQKRFITVNSKLCSSHKIENLSELAHLFTIDNIRDLENGTYIVCEDEIFIIYLFGLYKISAEIWLCQQNGPLERIITNDKSSNNKIAITKEEALYLLGFNEDKYTII